jgi:adenosylmethionine-8-amino-7-oxononanoate aminotransferase
MIDERKLWQRVFNGSPLAAALALTVLDLMHEGKLSRELAKYRMRL